MTVATLPPLSVLQRPLWDQLEQRLREAAAREPQNGPLIESIRGPVTTLQLLARDAPAALVGDALAIERLRVTLQAASEAAALVPVATAALRQYKDASTSHAPGLLQMRALAVLEAAALRTADDLAGMRYAIMVVTGLALQCGPAELLARLEPYGAADDAYDNLLRLAVPAIVAAGVASRVYLRGHARDPAERARWRCLIEVATAIAGALPANGTQPTTTAPSAIAAPRWSAASTAELTGVSRATEAEGAGALVLGGHFPWVAPSWPQESWAVVGSSASRSGAPAILGTVTAATTDRLTVTFPAPVSWVGLVARERVPAVDRARDALRAALGSIGKLPCAKNEPRLELSTLLPVIGDAWPCADPPPRTATNQVPAASAAEPPPPTPGQPPGTPSANPERLTVVVARVAAVDNDELVAYEAVQEVLTVIARRLSRELELLELPWVEDTLAVASSAPSSDEDPRVLRMLEALARTAARAPDLEHAVYLAVVPGASALLVTSSADAALGLAVATLAGLGRALPRLLEEANTTSELKAEAPLTRAGRLTVASRSPLAVEPARTWPAGERLRLIATLEGTELTLLEPPRYERRAAGRAAPVDTGAVAVCLDSEDHELGRVRLRAHRDAGPIAVAALIPVTPEVAAVEVRREQRVVARLERSRLPPQPSKVDLEANSGIVTARWSSPRSDGPVALTVEVSDDQSEAWVPLSKVSACGTAETVPLWRLSSALRLRLVACDGWHAVASKEVQVPANTLFGPVAIRRLDERTLWAELPAGATPVWRTELDHSERGRLLSVETGAGVVELSATRGDIALTDAILMERRRALRRR